MESAILRGIVTLHPAEQTAAVGLPRIEVFTLRSRQAASVRLGVA